MIFWNTKHGRIGRSTSPTYVLKYENIKCQQLPLILKMKLPIKLGSNAFLGYFIFFSFGRLWSDMDFYVLNCILDYRPYSGGKLIFVSCTAQCTYRYAELATTLSISSLYNLTWNMVMVKFEQYLVGVVWLFVFI